MPRPRTVALSCVLGLTFCHVPHASGQFARLTNPTFKVTLTHPPQIALKGVQKLAVRDISGECGLELSERLMQAVAETGRFEMIDRSHIEATLQEQNFHATGAVSLESALKLGRLLGPSAMFAGRVTRCTVQTSDPLIVPGQWKDARGIPATKYARRTTAQLTASLVLVDFTTGRTHTGRLIEARAEQTNEALNLAPEPPDRDVVQTQMYRDAIRQVMRVIEPWDETVEIIVYDDDDGNKFRLKPSTERMKRGDFTQAALDLEALIAQGGGPKVTDKERAKANYNYGIALMYSGRVNDALPALHKAKKLDPRNSIIEEGLQAAERKAALERERARVEASAVQFAGETGASAAPQTPSSAAPQAPPPAATPAPTAAGQRLSNADILEMLKAKLPESVILARIKNSVVAFDTSGKALAAFKAAGATEAVLLAIVTAPSAK